ncbi:WAT1-related protein At5g64700-like [Rhododendron vialii]|uniref:WAT1-related protein At5g64700-like n=1 Tax=Rhododendron vialii TaxID=182163 RepID=UPI00265EBA22|nr:WAT1-related protein At5g64700-like [Rhododendron vialii]
MGVKEWGERSQGVALMLMVQVIGTGLQLLSKVILGHGQFIFALMAYRHVVGALCVAPFAFFLERGKGKELSWSIGFWLFMNALTGISMAMGLFYYGLRDTTATYATNFLNLIPIVTFVFSIIVGMEKLRLGTRAGKVKTMGAILCAAGALTISLYKGKSFSIGHHSTHHKEIRHNVQHNWTRGTVFLVLSVLSYATWFMVQVKLFKLFPYKYWATMLTCIIASVQGAVVGLCIDTNKGSWALGWNLQLVTIIYSGMLATAATFCLISWAVANRGPTYPSMFNPLALIFVTITEALFLGEPITVGSLIGMSLIIAGLYSFLWGKSKESKNTTRPKLAMIEASVVVPDKSTALQTSAVVMPTASPSTTTVAVFGNAKPNENETFV